MYAAAGGASLASRQARQRQRQAKKQQLQAKLHPPKAVAGADAGASTPTRQSRQFHQLPTNYLRTPQQPAGRKLSASYTTQSRLLLPIDEGGDTQSVLHLRMHSHSHSHAHGPTARFQPYQQWQQQHQQAMASGACVQANAHAAATAAAVAAGQPPPPALAPRLIHRHSGSGSTGGFMHSHYPGQQPTHQQQQQQQHLHKSATSAVPLVTSADEGTPLATPTGAVAGKMPGSGLSPFHDAIIVTPATPMASPGHAATAAGRRMTTASISDRSSPDTPHAEFIVGDDDDADADVDVDAEAEADADDDDHDDGADYDVDEPGEDDPMQPPTTPLERKCSVYRMRRSDAFEDTTGSSDGLLKRQLRDLQQTVVQQQQQYEPLLGDEPQLLFKGLPSTNNGRKWQVCAYCEEGICVCEHLECAQGRAAWLERGRRCSVQETQQQQQAAACHRRWVKRNRIQDASLGGSSDDEDFLGVLRGPSTFANAFLYVGLGTIALGLVIAFVGTGEKGFKTVELRLIGPSLIVLGLVCCILRILFCICPSHCIASGKKARKKAGNKVDADHTTSLLRGESKRVSIARGPSTQTKYPLSHKRSQSKMLNEGMEALRQIATTSLFMQNEQKTPSNRVVPIIKEPERVNNSDAPLEMKRLEGATTSLHVTAMSSEIITGDPEDRGRQRVRRVTMNMDANTTTTTTTTMALEGNNEKQAWGPHPSVGRANNSGSGGGSGGGSGVATTTTATNTDIVIDINQSTTTATVATNTSLDRGIGGPLSSSSLSSSTGTSPGFNSKLAKQRVALHQKQQQRVEFSQTQSQSSNSNNSAPTMKDGIDTEHVIMETSLATATTTTTSASATPSPPSSASTVIAIPPPPSLATATATATATTSSASTSASATAYTKRGATAAGTTTSSSSIYDLMPSTTPHTYAAASNTAGLIRGPLGTPLSVLSSYSLSSAATAAAAASTSTITPPAVAAKNTSNATTNGNASSNGNAKTNGNAATNGNAIAMTTFSMTTMPAAASQQHQQQPAKRTSLVGMQRLSIGAGNAALPGQILEAPSSSSVSSSSSSSTMMPSGSGIGSGIGGSVIGGSGIGGSGIGGSGIGIGLSGLGSTGIGTGSGSGPTQLHNPMMATLMAQSKLEPELLLSPAKLGQ